MKHLMTAAAVAAILVGATATAQEISVRVGSFTPEGAVGVQNVMIPWMEAVEEELGDRIELTGYWGGTLGPDPFAQYELVRDGVIDVAWILPGYTPGQFPQLQITELPFAVQSGEEASTVAWRLYETGLLDGFDDVQVLSIWTPDITNIHLLEPIESLADLEGEALRTAGAEVSDIFVVFFYGAFPGALDALREAGVTMHYLATWDDVLKVAAEGEYFPPDAIQGVRDFLADPIAWSAVNGGKGAA